jgi:hypothetical protein
MVLEVPERVEEGIGISVLGEADAQVMLDRVTAADGDIVVVVSVPITSNQRPDTFGRQDRCRWWPVVDLFGRGPSTGG